MCMATAFAARTGAMVAVLKKSGRGLGLINVIAKQQRDPGRDDEADGDRPDRTPAGQSRQGDSHPIGRTGRVSHLAMRVPA